MCNQAPFPDVFSEARKMVLSPPSFVSSLLAGRNIRGSLRRRAGAEVVHWPGGNKNPEWEGTGARLPGRPGRATEGLCPVSRFIPALSTRHQRPSGRRPARCDPLRQADCLIGVASGKKPLFSIEERLEMVRAIFEPVARKAGLRLRLHHPLQSDRDGSAKGAHHHDPGLRDGTDLDYEMQSRA